MADDIEGLTELVLRNAGKHEAVIAYEEEIGCSHAEAVLAVKRIGRRQGDTKRQRLAGLLDAIIARQARWRWLPTTR